jgi:insecticidal toxin complex protein TccC
VGATTRSEINRGTPNVTVYSNQGLTVRQLSYCRRVAGEAAELRATVQRYNSAGQLTSSIDPRLSPTYLANSSSAIPNQQQQTTLSGKVLKSDNVDAGARVLVSDVRAQALWSWDSRGIERTFDYDALRRVTTAHEKQRSKDNVCTERLRYGEAADAAARDNRVGQLIEHFDTAGRHVMLAYSLLGQATVEGRTFLKPDASVNWADDASENEAKLEEDTYRSGVETNALGEILTQIDAANNARHTRYDIAGQVSQTTLQLSGAAEKSLVKNRIYRATGQLQEETLGNGVQLQYSYEADTQRLKAKYATRLSDNKVLQSLQYGYDPVGNILSIEDQVQETEYYKNGKAESISCYVYDTLYQLITADGIESEQANREGFRLPDAITFGNKDASRLVNYHRTYDYDVGGNLFEIIHQGAGTPYTRELTIDTLSNRGIEKRDSGPTLHESFDADGNLLYLNIGQPLNWDTRNQLQESIQVERANTLSDKEIYLYDGQGMRRQKTRIYLAENQIHTERVRYLSGLEFREHWQTDLQGENKQIREELYLIQAQAGDVPVKVLHWQTGPPDAIENDAIYYNLSDQIGSNQLELNEAAEIVSFESYYPYGGTAIWSTKNQIESNYKYYRYSGKERDHSGLYYYGYRYYMPWLGRWLNPDPSGITDGLNLFRMARNNPVTFVDDIGKLPSVYYQKKDLNQNVIEVEFVKGTYPELFELLYNKPEKIWSRKISEYIKPTQAAAKLKLFSSLPSPDETLAAIRAYTGSFVEAFQDISEDELSEKVTEAVSNIKPEKGLYFRGGAAIENVYGNKVKEGDIVTNNLFMSTTFHSAVAREFSLDLSGSAMLGPPKVERVFFLIESISGRNISPVITGALEYQREVLHLKNRNFRVNLIKEYTREQIRLKGENIEGDEYKKIKFISLSEVEGPFLYEEKGVIRNLAKNIYTGE